MKDPEMTALAKFIHNIIHAPLLTLSAGAADARLP